MTPLVRRRHAADRISTVSAPDVVPVGVAPTARLAAPAATIAIALVLLGLAAYSIAMDRRSSEATADAERAILVARAYGDVSRLLADLERGATAFIFSPNPEGRALFDEQVAEVLTRLDDVARIGTDDDVAIVEAIRDEYLPQLSAVQDFFDALMRGESYFGIIADEETVTALYAALEAPARARQETSLLAMGELRTQQQRRVLTTVGVFAVGVALVGILLWVERRSSIQMARAQAALTRLRRESATDSLTGLGNHRAFQEALRSAADAGGALVMVDLDRFKEANDLRGHAEGDQILRSVADILASVFPGRAYRIGGDEFAAMAITYPDATRRIGMLVKTLRDQIPGVTASAGVSSWEAGRANEAATGADEDAGFAEFDAQLVCAQADAALRWAKREGRNRWVGYHEIADRVGGVASSKKSQAIRQLLQQESGVTTVFQPIWGMNGELRACEALTRFAPELGLGGPEEVFDIANQDGRSLELDRLCFETALRHARALPPHIRLFANVSPSALIDQRFSVARLVASVREHGREPESVVIEITERADVPADVLYDRIEELRIAGFELAMDDVGAGNAGLERLRHVPVDWIKIDCSIVQAAPTNAVARGMMRALVAFAGEAGSIVITEGIETAAELEVARTVMEGGLARQTEVLAQGFYLGRPASATTTFATPASLLRAAA